MVWVAVYGGVRLICHCESSFRVILGLFLLSLRAPTCRGVAISVHSYRGIAPGLPFLNYLFTKEPSEYIQSARYFLARWMVQTLDNISEEMLLLCLTLPNLQRKCD